ncbi:neuromedin-U isoform X4 [Chiloscyllium plagiosum]|uniref:neuromedin-U isoform X4 n=1 Tax=Chiloscyllium plagiosum TaxID=36176 RepID=UPI001CB7B147|nr:neuromedin-U isoform X4 [Chiloscyllium plagiosum]
MSILTWGLFFKSGDAQAVKVHQDLSCRVEIVWTSMLGFNLCQCRGEERPPRKISMRHPPCILALSLFLLSCSCVSQEVLASPQRFPAEQELRLRSEIDDLCSSFLSAVPQSQPSSTLKELCYMALTILERPQDSQDKGENKREEFQGPGGIQSRGFFMFRPRNGRRSSSFR